MPKYPKEFMARCKAVKGKRARVVIDHILKHGSISTDDLKETYGYDHPPRAVRDVKDAGIPIERFTIIGLNGRKKAAYRFGDPTILVMRKHAGRTNLSKALKTDLMQRYGCRCAIYLETMTEAELQIDHRIPFEVDGDNVKIDPADFMLLCGSANRAKSWSCKHCKNWNNLKDREICLTCYWAYPENYEHIAMQMIRRVDLIWRGEDVMKYERLEAEAAAADMLIPDYVKQILDNVLN